ncbi:MAG: hypothetical protein HYV75_05985 [Opitutae bacterium]|nr:hypothetical protein [Opitutae bacterium]
MKATKLLLAAAVFTSLAALSYAGPGPDYWTRINKAEKDRAKAKAEAQAKVQAAPHVANCTACGCPSMKKS